MTSDSAGKQASTVEAIVSLAVVDGQLLVSDVADGNGSAESLSSFSGSC